MKLFILALFSTYFLLSIGENQQKFEGYVFVYFHGESDEGQKIYIAATQGNDALNWVELNEGKPILSSKFGTRGLRDPFIIRSHTGDKFYLLATDLHWPDWQDRNGSRYLEIWESNDLINWSEQRHTLVSQQTAGCTWAPEAYYDDSIGKYVVYWASTLFNEKDTSHAGPTYFRMMYATTTDFVTFSEPQIWQDPGFSRIDATVLKEGDVYHRFTKDQDMETGCRAIIQDRSTNLTAPLNAWKRIAVCIGKQESGSGEAEGPTIFKSNPGDVNGAKYYLFVDDNLGKGYFPLETTDIANPVWKSPKSYKLPNYARHGTVIPVTANELARVISKLGV